MAVDMNRSEAYDLALFEAKPAKIVRLKPNKKQMKIERRRARIRHMLRTIATLMLAGVVVGVVGTMITTRVRLTEMGSRITAYEKQLAELKSEQIRMEAELAGTLSAQSVDEYAQSQGMITIESNQIHYVTRGDGDEVEMTDKEGQHWWDSLFRAIANIFS